VTPRRPRRGGLSRRVSKQEIKRELLVFTEGRLTEPGYLVYWHREHRRRVSVEISEFHGGPLQLVKKAAEAKAIGARDQKRGRGRAWDEIWCVFDVDVHPDLPEALQIAGAGGIRVAVSNPCIELWFLLHFRDQTAFIDRKDAQRRCRTELACDKELTEEALSRLAASYSQARRRAIALDEKHEGDGSPPLSNPSSSVWELVDAICGS